MASWTTTSPVNLTSLQVGFWATPVDPSSLILNQAQNRLIVCEKSKFQLNIFI